MRSPARWRMPDRIPKTCGHVPAPTAARARRERHAHSPTCYRRRGSKSQFLTRTDSSRVRRSPGELCQDEPVGAATVGLLRRSPAGGPSGTEFEASAPLIGICGIPHILRVEHLRRLAAGDPRATRPASRASVYDTSKATDDAAGRWPERRRSGGARVDFGRCCVFGRVRSRSTFTSSLLTAINRLGNCYQCRMDNGESRVDIDVL